MSAQPHIITSGNSGPDPPVSGLSGADTLRSPLIENLKLEDLSLSSGVSESSENEDENKPSKNRKETGRRRREQKPDQEEAPYEPPSEEVQAALIKQLEFYFSDENIVKDNFLLRHIRQDKAGFVSLKLLGTFRRIQKMSKDWRDLRCALRKQRKEFDRKAAEATGDQEIENVPLLQLNNNGTKVKRVKPIPDWDDTVHDRTILVFNYQTILKSTTSPIETVAAYFSENKQDSKNEIALVRLTVPGKKLPEDLNQLLKLRPEIASKPCALVEFKSVDLAQRALLRFNGANDWRGLQVLPLKMPDKKRRATDDQSRNQQHAKMAGKNAEKTGLSSSLKAEFLPLSTAVVDSHSNSGSPKPSRRRPPNGPGSPHAQRHGPFRAVHHSKETAVSLSACHLNDCSPLSCSPSSLDNCGSPWLRKKMMLGSNGDLATGQKDTNLITVIRQPRGPDNTKGFSRPIN